MTRRARTATEAAGSGGEAECLIDKMILGSDIPLLRPPYWPLRILCIVPHPLGLPLDEKRESFARLPARQGHRAIQVDHHGMHSCAPRHRLTI